MIINISKIIIYMSYIKCIEEYDYVFGDLI
uniref:Uncharacterized protein n=1 Tax=viral metagenome TaxID=1070528 RepID=A0A6C0H9S5_9ZZZZ